MSTPIPEPGPATRRATQPATQPAMQQPATQPAMEPPTDPAMAPVPPSPRARGGILIAVAVGTLVAVGIGVYGRLHEPTLFAINVAGFSSGIAAKAWLASIAFVLALVQLASAMIMYGRFPRITAPSWIGGLHRWSGRVAVLVTVPVAVHCLYALGFEYGEPRVLVHSLCGCLFYGAFAAKMLVLTRPGTPKWSLPVLGGLVFTLLVALWLTSSVWFFSTSGLTF